MVACPDRGPRSSGDEGRRDRCGPGRPGTGAAAAGGRLRGHRARAARGPGRPDRSPARRRVHVGHRRVGDHDAVADRGDVRRRRDRPAQRGLAAAPGPALPAALGQRPANIGLRRLPGAAARGGGEVLHARRAARRRLPRRRGPDLRARGARRRAPPAATCARSRHGCPRLLRLGALEPLYRFVSRFFHHPRVREAFSFHSLFIGGDPFRVPADLRLAGLPAGPRRRLVRRRRRLLAGRADRPPARRALRRAGRRRGDRGRPRARCAARGRRADRGRRGRLQRRRAADRRAARPRGGRPAAAPDDVVLSASRRPPAPVRGAGAPHAAGRSRLPRLRAERHAGAPAAADVLRVRARPGAD